MIIFGKEIKLGQSAIINMNIAKSYTRSTIEVPIIVERSKKEGPCLLLIGGIHGDEVNGIEIVRQIVAKKWNKPDRGTVICIPVLNVFGFLSQQREFPDGRDLNRVFPGSIGGSLASRFAYHFMKEVIPHVDYCIDYHTGGAQRFNSAQVRLSGLNEENLMLAQNFGAPYILFAKNKERTFRETMARLGKKVLLFEGGKSLHLDNEITKIGVQGAINTMNQLEIKDTPELLLHPQERMPSILIQHSKWIRAKHAGMYRPTVNLGEKVQKGTILGSISDPFGSFEKHIKSNQAGYVICSNYACLVNQGDALFHIGSDI